MPLVDPVTDSALAGDDSDVLIRVENVSKKFCRSLKRSLWYGVQDIASELVGRNYKHDLRPDEFWAVKDVSFELRRGECLGLIGRNGAGKTTLLRMLNGLIKPDQGRIFIRGRIGALIALGAGFNPILTGRENIYVNASVLGLNRKEIDEKVGEIIDFAEIKDFIDSPVSSYSSGMQVRLGFAIATTIKPDILILDEVLSVGDIYFRDKCYAKISKLTRDTTVILVTHDTGSLLRMCNKGIILSKGKSSKVQSINDAYFDYVEQSLNSSIFNTFKYKKEKIVNAIDIKVNSLSTQVRNEDYYQDIYISLNLVLNEKVDIGLCLGNINLGLDNAIAQFDCTTFLKELNVGLNFINFCLPRVMLAKGVYNLSMVAFAVNKSDIIFSVRNISLPKTNQSTRYGPAYAPIAVDNSEAIK